jgi:hypothetical protein
MVAAASTANGSSSTDPNWLTELPNIIDYAEQRIYRELDLLATRVTDTSGSLTANNRVFSLPTSVGTYVVLEYLNVLSPSSATFSTGTRNQLVPVSRAYLDAAWPVNSISVNTIPQCYAMRDNASVVLGPWPDQNYPVECIGTQRPTPLSAANQSTYLSTVLPDLFFAASMIKASVYMRDLSPDADNPMLAVSWEGIYGKLMMSADNEEARKMYRSAGWTAQMSRPATTPPRV